MTIPRNRKEFTEDSLTDWITGQLDKSEAQAPSKKEGLGSFAS